MVVYLLSWQGKLRTYRYCDCVWTFILRDVKFSIDGMSGDIGKVKIVACDSRLMKPDVPPQQ
jgi:transcription initiation factor TFIIA small subunit